MGWFENLAVYNPTARTSKRQVHPPTTFPVASPATPIPMLLRKSRFEIIAISFAFVFP